jgi:poly-gamma-glutamate synthesis protein (capsule biosynthesis protein)
MIILGDIAVPNKKLASVLERTFNDNSNIFSGQRIILNLEGMIADQHSADTETPVLFNHSALLDILKKYTGGSVAALANNHTLDLPEKFEHTINLLEKANIPFAGAGNSAEEAELPAMFSQNGRKGYLFNYCWDFLLYHQRNPSKGVYVAEIDEMKILKQVTAYRAEQPDASIVVYFHWSLDLEILPYPMYRVFSRALIDAGANIVAGCHSHCVQGGEKYKEGYIVYGLGNFYIPWNEYASGKLRFPEFSKITMALEWDSDNNDATCHWFEYNEEKRSLDIITSEPFENSFNLAKYSPFDGMSDEEYERYFVKHRRKSFLIPVFSDHTSVLKNRVLTYLLKLRARTARKLAELNIVNWQS